MEERDDALKIATKSKLSHDRHTFATVRNRITREMRKVKVCSYL